jgi:HSP20 family protein
MTVFVRRRNPLREAAVLQSAMDRFFEDAWRNDQPAQEQKRENLLALDVYETDTDYTVFATLPGLTSDALNVTLHDDTLTISAQLPQTAAAAEGERVLVQERVFGNISRSINLPQPVDAAQVSAELDNGVLTLTLAKAAHAQPRQIPVHGTGVVHSQN